MNHLFPDNVIMVETPAEAVPNWQGPFPIASKEKEQSEIE